MPCLRTRKTTRSTDTEVEEFLEERYSCDVMNICASQNFSSVLLQACKVIWVSFWKKDIVSCDVMNIFASHNLSSVLLQACKAIWVSF